MIACIRTKLCPALCDPMDYSLPGSSVPGILQARILECHFLLQGVFLTQASNLHFFPSPALAYRFFTASATWDFVAGAQSVWKDVVCNKVKASTAKG